MIVKSENDFEIRKWLWNPKIILKSENDFEIWITAVYRSCSGLKKKLDKQLSPVKYQSF